MAAATDESAIEGAQTRPRAASPVTDLIAAQVELAFQRVPGVAWTKVGYTDGQVMYPTYEQVCAGTTGHTEAVCVTFRPLQVSFDELLTVLWDRADPGGCHAWRGVSSTSV